MRALLMVLFVFGALWCPKQAVAAVVYKTGELCVDVETTVVDLAGDEWTESGPTPRAAYGVKFDVTDTVGTTVGYLDADGCVSVGVWVESNNGTLQLRVSTKAFVNGVYMESWEGDDYNATHDFQAVVWPTISTGTGTTFSQQRTVGNGDQRWLNLMVGTMVFRTYDWNVEEPNGRGCCLEGESGYDDDGTCTDPATGGYELLTTPIQMQSDPSVAAGNCCGSTLYDVDTIDFNEPPGLHTGTDVSYKFSIAHELGHVIAEMRTGSKEWGEYNSDAPENGCDGDGVNQVDRGEFTKEPLSNVFRESWGNFVSAVTWNSRSQDDCEFQVYYVVHDFDLDGDIDDNRTGTSMDGAFDCEGIPTLSGDLAVGDFDGDGQDDLAVGGASEVTIWLGPLTAGTLSIEAAAARYRGPQFPSDQLGHALAAADTDGDGRSELAIGAPYENTPDEPCQESSNNTCAVAGRVWWLLGGGL